MPVDLAKFQALKAKADELQREADRAAGVYEATMVQIAADYGPKTLKAAERMAAQLEDQAKAAEEEYTAALAAFEEEWGHVFDGVPAKDH